MTLKTGIMAAKNSARGIEVNMVSQDGAEDGSRVASSGKTLQFFVCFICFFVVLRVRCC